jgi:hypothetical protein
VLNPVPGWHDAAYRAWESRGATVTVETDLRACRQRMLHGRFSFVFVPAGGEPMADAPDEILRPVTHQLRPWVEAYEPSYRERLGIILAGAPKDRSLGIAAAAAHVHLLALPPFPTADDVERSEQALDAMVGQLRAWTTA